MGWLATLTDRSTLEIAVGIATILATVLALPPASQFIRDRLDSSRKVRQQVLNALPNPKQKAIQSASTSYQARVNYILANGGLLDLTWKACSPCPQKKSARPFMP